MNFFFSKVSSTQNSTGPLHGKIVMCPVIYTDSINSTSPFNIENADLNLCTHLICLGSSSSLREIEGISYLFQIFYSNLKATFDSITTLYTILFGSDIWNQNDLGRDSYYKRMTNLRQKYPHLKVNHFFLTTKYEVWK